MADKDFEIGINTTSDTSGIKKAEKAVDDLKDSLAGAGEAGTNDIVEASIGNIPTELEDVRKLLKDTREELAVLTEGSEDFKVVEKAVIQLETGLEDLTDQAKKADKEFEDLANNSKKAKGELGKLGKEADSTADDLKQIAALETAAALQEAVSGARAAGEQLVILKDQVSASNGSFGETAGIVQTGIGAVTQFATAARAAYLALGPVGIALAVVATALSVAAAAFDDTAEKAEKNAEKQRKAIDKAAEAARKQEQAAKDLKTTNEKLEETLRKQGKRWDDLRDSIEKVTDAKRRDLQFEDELIDAQLAFDISKVDRDKNLSEVEKIEARAKLRFDAQKKIQANELALQKANIEEQQALARAAQDEQVDAENRAGIGAEQERQSEALKVIIAEAKVNLEKLQTQQDADIQIVEKEESKKRTDFSSDEEFAEASTKQTLGIGTSDVQKEIGRIQGRATLLRSAQDELEDLINRQAKLAAKAQQNIGFGQQADEKAREVELAKENVRVIKQEIEQREKLNAINNSKLVFEANDDSNVAKKTASDLKKQKEAQQAKKDKDEADKAAADKAKAEQEAQGVVATVPGLLDDAGAKQRVINSARNAASRAKDGFQGNELSKFVSSLEKIIEDINGDKTEVRQALTRLQKLEDQTKNGGRN